MNIAIVGGGPGGLYLATLLKAADPGRRVSVFERNPSDETFGFGVVFSDTTMRSLAEGDAVVHRRLESEGIRWQDIEVRRRGRRLRCGGNGFAAIARHRLLRLLQQRCRELGVGVRFRTPVELEDLEGVDLIVAADGANSRVRDRLAGTFRPEITTAGAKFIWFGTTAPFDALTFLFERTGEGWFAVHGYPIDRSRETGTFIVETDAETWRRAALDEFDVTRPPGPSDMKSKEYMQAVFADHLAGHELLVNNSRWANFRTVRCARWRADNVVLLGDAAHTAHFSVGSGTRMAMQDALALAQALDAEATLDDALERYEAERHPQVDRIQDAARPSLTWWERFGTYADRLEPEQFAYHFLTRSGRVDHRRLAQGDPEFVGLVERWFSSRSGLRDAYSPMQVPLRAPVEFPTRVVALEDGLPVGAVRVESPPDGGGLASALLEAGRAVGGGAALIAVDPPRGQVTAESRLCATLLAEHVRFELGAAVLLRAPGLDISEATTWVLSGRADLVAMPRECIDPMSGLAVAAGVQ
jgi:salicyloyl-CoA 5-hydroxylase